MSVKNSEVWFSFLDTFIGKGPTPVRIETNPICLSQDGESNLTPPTPNLPRKGGGGKELPPPLRGRFGVGGDKDSDPQTTLSRSTFLHHVECLGTSQDQNQAGLVFAAAIVDEGPVSRGIRSGDPSLPLIELESTFRELRARFPSLPLLAMLKPDSYRPRCHAWMLGEYLAERDLLLWASLCHLHPARMADWARNLSECGLASPRAVIQVTERLDARDLPALAGTGVWLVRPESRKNPDRAVVLQV